MGLGFPPITFGVVAGVNKFVSNPFIAVKELVVEVVEDVAAAVVLLCPMIRVALHCKGTKRIEAATAIVTALSLLVFIIVTSRFV
jgi:hypothetical protein